MRCSLLSLQTIKSFSLKLILNFFCFFWHIAVYIVNFVQFIHYKSFFPLNYLQLLLETNDTCAIFFLLLNSFSSRCGYKRRILTFVVIHESRLRLSFMIVLIMSEKVISARLTVEFDRLIWRINMLNRVCLRRRIEEWFRN